MTYQVQLGTAVTFAYRSGEIPVLIKDGVVVALPVSTALIPGGLGWYSATFYPNETGFYQIIDSTSTIGSVQVSSRDVFSFLRNLEDQALGSWDWDKTTKQMVLYRQDGSTLASFTTEDTIERAYSTLNPI